MAKTQFSISVDERELEIIDRIREEYQRHDGVDLSRAGAVRVLIHRARHSGRTRGALLEPINTSLSHGIAALSEVTDIPAADTCTSPLGDTVPVRDMNGGGLMISNATREHVLDAAWKALDDLEEDDRERILLVHPILDRNNWGEGP